MDPCRSMPPTFQLGREVWPNDGSWTTAATIMRQSHCRRASRRWVGLHLPPAQTPSTTRAAGQEQLGPVHQRRCDGLKSASRSLTMPAPCISRPLFAKYSRHT